MICDERFREMILSCEAGDRLPSERELATEWDVSRSDLRKTLADLESRGVIIRRRRTGTVVASDAAEILKTAVYVGRKSRDEMDGDRTRLLRSATSTEIEDSVAASSSTYRLVVTEHISDPVHLRTQGCPTVIGSGGRTISNIHSYGLCEDLTEQIHCWDQFESFWPNLWESVTLDGCILAVPTQAHVFVLFCNLSRMKQCGLNPDSPPRTWAELTEAALRMTDQDAEFYGLAFPEDNHLSWGFTDLCYQAGGKLIERNGLSWIPTFDQPPCVDALTYLKELRWKHKVLLPNAGSSTDVAKAFFEGRAAMCIMESTDMFNHIAKQGWSESEISVSPLPAGPNGHAKWHVSVSVSFINAYASKKEKAAAWQHIQNLNSREVNLKQSNEFWKQGLVYGWPSVYRNTTSQETAIELPHEWFRTVQSCVAQALPEPSGSGWDAEIYLKPVLRRILEDERADPQHELSQAVSLLQPGLELH